MGAFKVAWTWVMFCGRRPVREHNGDDAHQFPASCIVSHPPLGLGSCSAAVSFQPRSCEEKTPVAASAAFPERVTGRGTHERLSHY